MNIILTTLTYTWGIVMTLVGYIVRFIFLCIGIKGERYVLSRVYVVGNDWGGISLGNTIVVSKSSNTDYVKQHEVGHVIQNAIMGPLFIFIVALPSLIRSQYRNAQIKKGILPKTDYYSIWFEAQANKLGQAYCKKFN